MGLASQQDKKHVEQIVVQAKSSFAMGMQILAPEDRPYLFAIYAFARTLDDIADAPVDRLEKCAKLADWRQKVEDLPVGKTSCSITRLLHDALEHYDIPHHELISLIEGMEMDANGPVVAPTWDELYGYCRRVAVSVGLLSLPVFGRNDKEAESFAEELGYALQLTNILRDIEEDCINGRIYIPKEELDKVHIPPAPEILLKQENLKSALGRVSLVCDSHFANAQKILDTGRRDNLRPAIIMMIFYQRLFEKMKARGWQKISPRMRLNKLEKGLLFVEALKTA